jgi:antirestriction protein ArdC
MTFAVPLLIRTASAFGQYPLEVLKNDNRAIFAAAAHAQRAADYLHQKAAAQVPETCVA